ncbi:DNA polymerase I [Magnetofaba australis]|uniref:DNA polymerase I n=1 Tax=Magnetofaba australis IT-1 TaxID=1434232 RepID=A0A1Y2K828_9PROT|nr:DNA polymerase I [Magnetofaba australis]OSM06900.1 putative DNA polymerase I [Magnetofaba australis IT-1]
MTTTDTPRLFLVDGSGYLYRAFYGVRNLSRRDGFPTNAIFGFDKMLRKVVVEARPTHLVMVFDAKGPTFRHEMDENYKAHRKPMPDELRAQIPGIQRLVDCYNIPRIEMPGYEADDVIGSLARLGVERDWQVVVVSGDKDLMQLVSSKVQMFDGGKEKWYDPEDVMETWGVGPERIPDLLGLAGDASDNIPGVPGIGAKTAAQLLKEYGDMERLLANAGSIKQPKRRQALLDNADIARHSKKMATIDIHAPVNVDLLEQSPLREPDLHTLAAFYTEMEFTSLARKTQQLAAQRAADDESPVPLVVPTDPEQAAEIEDPQAREAEYHAITTQEGFDEFLRQLGQRREFAIDTETTSLDTTRADLVGISIAWAPKQAWYLPLGHNPLLVEEQLDRDATLAALKPILENPAIGKCGQNLKYDWQIFRRYGIDMRGVTRDSLLLSFTLYGATRGHSLDALALEELGRTTISFKEVCGTGKKQITFDQVLLEQAVPYACEDAEIAWSLCEKLDPLVKREEDLTRLYRDIELPVMAVLAEMERVGALIDKPALAKMSDAFTARRQELSAAIFQLAGEEFNLNSTQQLGKLLFDTLGIKGGKRTKTGFSTDVTVLEKLADKASGEADSPEQRGYRIAEQLLEYRQITKLQSTYTDALQGLINPDDGRVHTSYNQAVALTGRLSSSDPNLQNIPIRTEAGRAIRTAFVAPPDHVLLAADYSQIELRLLAHMGDVPRLKQAFADGLDIHSATAAELFGGSPDAVDADARRKAKTINFGLVYGMSPFGLAKRLGVSNDEARAYMDLYFARYDGVRQQMDRAIQQARDLGYVTTLGGRRCPIRDINASNRNAREFAERTAINAPLQGSAADLIKLAMIRLSRALRDGGFKSRMILQVHDELVLEVPNSELAQVKPVVRAAMEGAFHLSVPLVVDMGTGPNWAEAH